MNYSGFRNTKRGNFLGFQMSTDLSSVIYEYMETQ